MKNHEFFYPQHRYRGEPSPENVVFNAKLQNFATRITYICGLETSGKLSSQEAYKQIKTVWKQLKVAKKQLKLAQAASNRDHEPTMIAVGTLVRIHAPDYASGLVGEVLAQEKSGRWIVKVESPDPEPPLLLSLEGADFQLLNFPDGESSPS